MARRMVRPVSVGALAALCALMGVNSVIASGYWNIPSDFCQWLGSGYGGGYHAPLMLGPPQCDCFRRPNEVRLPSAPNPYACQPTCNGGCGGCYCGGAQATAAPMPQYAPQPQPMAYPVAQPVAMPQTMPSEAMPQTVTPLPPPQEELPTVEPRGALFAPPVQQ